MRTFLALLAASLISGSAFGATMAVGSKPAPVTIQGDDGGLLNGKPWSSDMIKGKVWALFYVDPDKRNANEELETTLQKENFPKDKYGSIGMINMAATWLPNAAIASSLEDKQEKYPDTVYVKDLNKVMVDKWKLTDDEYVVVVFDKQGTVVYAKDGEFGKSDIQAMIAVIRANLDK
jgi:predicted transcriptional regulator